MGKASGNEALSERYWAAIQRHVCRVCLDQADDGSCGLPRLGTCPIRAHLPLVVAAVRGESSPRLDEYAAAIRADVCTSCGQQDMEGRCARRDAGGCALWTYLALVVDAVETQARPEWEEPTLCRAESGFPE